MYVRDVLPDRAHGKAEPIVERAIRDVDVGRVLLHADRIVSVVDFPSQERDIVGIDSLRTHVSNCHVRQYRQARSYVHAVRIHNTPKVSPGRRGAANVDVLQQHAL